MKLKKIIYIIISVLMCLSLGGCNMFTSDTAELLSPPALSGDIAPIAEALRKSVTGEYTLKYPSSGDYRSAVVQNDVDHDGILEAFAFYSTAEEETTVMHINVISNQNGKWSSVATQKIIAAGIDKIEFCDLDDDGVEEILVGWEVYGKSEMQLAVYSFNKKTLNQRMLQRYTRFICCDLDENGENEVMVVKLNAVEEHNVAAIYALTDEGINEAHVVMLDSDVKSVSEPVFSTLSSGKPAIYIDEVKGVGTVTEVLFIEKNKLVSPLNDIGINETSATLRATLYSISDINGDGIIEIPVQYGIPSATTSSITEKLYLINWCSYNGETLTPQMTTVMNTNDGYYYIVPPKWVGNIAAFKDTENSVRELYKYDSKSNTVLEKLIHLRAVKKTDWEKGKYKDQGYEEIVNNGITTFVCTISKAGKAEGVTLESIKKNFKIIE